MTAWLDLLLGAPRSFSARSRQMSTAFTLVYTQWILVCRVANNEFPYPFMNKMPFPQVLISPPVLSSTMHMPCTARLCAVVAQGFFFVSISATLLLYALFSVGAFLSRKLGRSLPPIKKFV